MKATFFWLVLSILAIGGLMVLACAQTENLRSNGTMPAASPASSQANEQTAAQKHPEVEFTVGCYECHTEATPEVAEQWYQSTHGKLNIGCFICHDDGIEEFSPKPTTERCLTCHTRQEVNFAKSEASSCFSCHNGHTLTFHN